MKPDKNKALMLACGSKTGAYDCEAPDQWRWVMVHAKDPLERGMAWVKSKTTAYHHESPFCVDDHGRPLYVQHMAADLGWAEQTARNVLSELQSQGRLKLKGKRIWYCADVPQAYQEPEEQPEAPDRRTKGERFNSVRSYFGSYVADFIANKPEEKQFLDLTTLEAWQNRKRDIFADTMAAVRMKTDPIEDSILVGQIGISKKRLPKRRHVDVRWVQLELVENPNPVQSTESPRTDSVLHSVDARAVLLQQQQQRPTSAPVSSSSALPSSSRLVKPAPPSAGATHETRQVKTAPPAAGAAYETARDELIAIYRAKTGELPAVMLLNRIETLLLNKGRNFEAFLDVLRPHLGNEWRNPPAFLTHKAKFGFLEAIPVPEPQLKLAPKCPRCLSRGGRGAVFFNGTIIACPDCTTSDEWREKVAAKMKPKTLTQTGGAA
jgi:hypothetical protein